MTINVQKIASDKQLNHLQLAVTEQGPMHIQVDSGKFVIGKKQYEVREDIHHTFEPKSNCDVIASGYLVKRSNGDIDLLVDEVAPGDVSYKFGDPDFKLLHKLFHAKLPAGVFDLQGVDIRVFHVLPEGD